VCHPDEASNVSGWKDLGQLRDSEAGTGFEIAQRSFANAGAHASEYSLDAATQNRNRRRLRPAVRDPFLPSLTLPSSGRQPKPNREAVHFRFALEIRGLNKPCFLP
jgi:hypothetical protein